VDRAVAALLAGQRVRPGERHQVGGRAIAALPGAAADAPAGRRGRLRAGVAGADQRPAGTFLDGVAAPGGGAVVLLGEGFLGAAAQQPVALPAAHPLALYRVAGVGADHGPGGVERGERAERGQDGGVDGRLGGGRGEVGHGWLLRVLLVGLVV